MRATSARQHADLRPVQRGNGTAQWSNLVVARREPDSDPDAPLAGVATPTR